MNRTAAARPNRPRGHPRDRPGFGAARALLLCLVLVPAARGAEVKQGSLSWSNLRAPVIKNLNVRAFARDRDRVFWGTRSGFYFLNKSEGRFSSLFTPFDSVEITGIHPGGRDIVWLATWSGVYKVDLANLKVLAHYTKAGEKEMDGTPAFGGLSSDSIKAISGNDEYIYVGTDRWGINLIDVRTGQVLKERITTIDGLPSDRIQDISISPSLLLVSTDQGIAWQARWDRMWESAPDHSPAKGVKAQQAVYLDGRIYLATGGDGLLVFSPETPELVASYTTAKKILPSDSVRCLAVDGRSLWVATLEGLLRLQIDTLEWESFAPFTRELLTRVFIDGNRVYAGSDGEGVFSADKGSPEIAFYPELRFTDRRMSLMGAMVSDREILPLEPGHLRYRDADMQSAYGTGGVSLVSRSNGNIFHDVVASIDFSRATGGVGKIWNFEISIEVRDQMGRSNRATERFLYDSKKPRIDLVKFATDSVAHTADRVMRFDGKVVEKRVWEFTAAVNGELHPVGLDRFGNFAEKLALRPGTNQVVFHCVDYCRNESRRGVTVIFDDAKPALVEAPGEITSAEANASLSFAYATEHLESAVIRDPESPLPIQCQIDPAGRRIIASVRTPDKPREYRLELTSKSRQKASYAFTLLRDADKPVILLNDETNEITTDFRTYILGGMVKSPVALTVTAMLGKKSLPVDYNPASQRFRVTVSMTDPTNRIRLVASSSPNRNTEKWVTLYSRLKENAGAVSGDGGPPGNEVERLRRENEALRAQKRVVVAVNAGPPSAFFSTVPCLLLEKVAPSETLSAVAGRFYGEERHVEALAAVNATIPGEALGRRGALIVPNGAMLELLTKSANPALLDLIQAVAEAHFNGETTTPYRFKQALAGHGGAFLASVERDSVVLQAAAGQVSPAGARQWNRIALTTTGNLVRVNLL